MLISAPASAAAFTAANETELSDRIGDANANPDVDTITITADFTLTGDMPTITESLEIIGTGFTVTTGTYLAVDVAEGIGDDIHVTLTNVTMTGAGTNLAVQTFNSGVTVSGSLFFGAPVFMGASGDSILVTDSAFEDTSSADGLSIGAADASTVAITSSRAHNNGDAGFSITVTNSTVTLTDVAMNGNDGHGLGIEADDSSVTITECTADLNLINGVNIEADDDSTILMDECDANDNTANGYLVLAEDGSTATITNSTATDHDDYGFHFDAVGEGSTVTLTSNTATDNEDVGFGIHAFEGGSATGSDLTGTGNEDAGLDVFAEESSTVTVTDSVFSGSTDGYGAALFPYDDSTITLQRVVVADNLGWAGGILIAEEIYEEPESNSTVTIVDSTIDGNEGSGIFIDEVSWVDIVIERSTISDNDQEFGGGIYAEFFEESSLTLQNVTVSDNDAWVAAGIFISGNSDDTAQLAILHSTIVDNEAVDSDAPGGIWLSNIQYSIDHSIVANNFCNEDPFDIEFSVQLPPTGAINFSLVETSFGAALAAVTAGTDNLVDTDPLLGPLADNGGHTLTHLPASGSPVINAGNVNIVGAPSTDQRGENRISDGTIDMGAVEVQAGLAVTGPDATAPLVFGALVLAAGVALVTVRRRLTAQ